MIPCAGLADYAGFEPETANIFRKMIGLPLLNWEETKMKYDKLVQTNKATIPKDQKSLSDYLQNASNQISPLYQISEKFIQ